MCSSLKELALTQVFLCSILLKSIIKVYPMSFGGYNLKLETFSCSRT